jgi:uncharacterized protein with ATP-grasp and redox domains
VFSEGGSREVDVMSAFESLVKSMIAGAFIGLTLSSIGCEQQEKDTTQIQKVQAMKSIDEVIKVYADSMLAIPGVVGLYHGLDENGESCLKVMVVEKTAELEKKIPKQIEGYPVEIDETGEIKPMK